MVERTSQAVQINTGDVQAQQSSMGYQSPDANQFATSKYLDAMPEVSNAGDRILSKLMSVGSTLADQAIAKSREEAYLDGVAKAGTNQSEAALNANPFMRNWQTAGYRDTMGRVAAADNEAKIATDMHKMREQSPEKFGEYIAERRASVTSQWEGMSMATRTTMFAQQMLNERAAIKKHAAEYYKFGVETEQKSVKVALDTSLFALDAAKGDEGAYLAATKATHGTAYSSIVTNPKLPNEVRGKMVYQLAEHALATDNQLLYKQIMQQDVPHADGTSSPMGSLVNREDTISLVGQHRASADRTEGITALKFHSELAYNKADWDNPNTPMQSYESVQKLVEDGHAKGYFGRGLESATKAAAVLNDHARAMVKKEKSAGLANAFPTGDVERVGRLNATRQDSVEAWGLTYGAKMALPDRVNALINQGLLHQWPEAFKAAGTTMQPAWAQAMSNDTINPANATMLQNVMLNIDKAEAGGKQGVMQNYIAAFNDTATQDFILRVRANANAGDPPTVAIMKARSSQLEETKAGNSGIYTELRAKAHKDDAAAISAITPVGMFGGAWGAVKGVFSSIAEKQAHLQVHADYWENPSRVAENEGMVKGAVAKEMSDLVLSRPTMDAKGRELVATAAVVNRSVLTPWGPLIGPQGRTLETIYGVKDPERVSSALQQIVKPQAGNRVSFQFDMNSSLIVTERNGKDGMSKSYTIDPMQIKAVAEDQRKAEEARYSIISGAGSKVGDVQFNGVNALGVPNVQMYEFRQRLLKHEGYTDTVSDDVGGAINKRTGKPVQTVGPGLSDTGTYFPKPDANGKITPKQASDGLRDASEEAAKAAGKWMSAGRGSTSPRLFQMYSELAYQGGAGNKAMNPLIKAIGDRDWAGAKVALEATPAWKMARNSARRKYYDESLKVIMKE